MEQFSINGGAGERIVGLSFRRVDLAVGTRGPLSGRGRQGERDFVYTKVLLHRRGQKILGVNGAGEVVMKVPAFGHSVEDREELGWASS